MRVFGRFLVGLAAFLLLLPFFLDGSLLVVVLLHLSQPQGYTLTAHALSRSLRTYDDAHQPEPLVATIAILHGNGVGVGGGKGQHGANNRKAHVLRHAVERFLDASRCHLQQLFLELGLCFGLGLRFGLLLLNVDLLAFVHHVGLVRAGVEPRQALRHGAVGVGVLVVEVVDELLAILVLREGGHKMLHHLAHGADGHEPCDTR